MRMVPSRLRLAFPAAVSQRLHDEIKKVEEILPRVDRGAALFLLAHD
jgi:hypothetical protein